VLGGIGGRATWQHCGGTEWEVGNLARTTLVRHTRGAVVEPIEAFFDLLREPLAARDLVGDHDGRDAKPLGDARADHHEHGLAHLRASSSKHMWNRVAWREASAATQRVENLSHVLWHVEEAPAEHRGLRLQQLPQFEEHAVAAELLGVDEVDAVVDRLAAAVGVACSVGLVHRVVVT